MLDRLALLAMLSLAAISPATAADAVIPPPPTHSSDGNVFKPPAPDCLQWTDQCRVCSASDAGPASCSNVGIACVPKGIVCTRHRHAPEAPKPAATPAKP